MTTASEDPSGTPATPVESDARYRLLLEITAAVTWSCPPTGFHIKPQRKWMAFTGQTAEEMLGDGWSKVVHPDDRQAIVERWAACTGSGEPFRSVARFRRYDGAWRWMNVLAVPIVDDAGKIVEWFGMHVDITERKELELRLETALSLANAANESKSAFLANMSHEIRTPLTGVIGMLDVLARTSLDEAQQEHVATAIKSARDLMHVLDDLLDITAIEGGRVSIQNRPFDLRRLIEDKLALFHSLAEARGLWLEAEFDPAVPDWILADERRLGQVINNLVGNAIKYTREGGVSILAGYDAQRGVLRLDIRDTGIGMSDATQARLFEPFFQADAAPSRPYAGSGLGLAISRKLTRLMHGEIGVTSREGKGSTFLITIPAPPTEAPGAGVSEEEPEALPPLRILVAEDHPTSRLILREILTSMGHQVKLVEDGAPAVAEAATGRYDVILMDVMMPGMDGRTATRQIRELGGRAGGVPIIAVTADAMTGRDSRFLLAGMTDCVTKPIDVSLLMAALRRVALRGTYPSEVAGDASAAAAARGQVEFRADGEEGDNNDGPR